MTVLLDNCGSQRDILTNGWSFMGRSVEKGEVEVSPLTINKNSN